MYHHVCVERECAEAMVNRPAMPARIKPPLESLTHRTKRQIRRKLLRRKGAGGDVKEVGLRAHQASPPFAKDTSYISVCTP